MEIAHTTFHSRLGTVLVHMLAAVLRRRAIQRGRQDNTVSCIPALYITCSSPFQEVEDFVMDSIRRYNLRLVRQGGGMKEGLEMYLNGVGQEEAFEHAAARRQSDSANGDARRQPRKRDIKAIFVGTRRTDPHGGA